MPCKLILHSFYTSNNLSKKQIPIFFLKPILQYECKLSKLDLVLSKIKICSSKTTFTVGHTILKLDKCMLYTSLSTGKWEWHSLCLATRLNKENQQLHSVNLHSKCESITINFNTDLKTSKIDWAAWPSLQKLTSIFSLGKFTMMTTQEIEYKRIKSHNHENGYTCHP